MFTHKIVTSIVFFSGMKWSARMRLLLLIPVFWSVRFKTTLLATMSVYSLRFSVSMMQRQIGLSARRYRALLLYGAGGLADDLFSAYNDSHILTKPTIFIAICFSA